MNRLPPPVLKDFRGVSAVDLYGLFRDVYSSSDGMSELLEDKYPNVRRLEEDVAALCRLPGAIALVAEVDARPAGYVVIRPRAQARLRHTADLNMGVAPAAQGRRLGSLMIQAALDRVVAEGVIEIVYLMVRADNEAAIRLYRNAGFEQLAVLDRDTKIGEGYGDGILMRKFVHETKETKSGHP
jgi:ribosomal protein S18 acetylase RimI-like enzyme